jgi:DNA-binding PadR family transcriptional regulator
MMHDQNLDELFARFLPSATAEQIESARWRILQRVRSEAATAPFELPLNHADYHVLLALSDDDRHGYGIMREVEAFSEGATKFGPGTLYTCIDRLLTAGWIQESHHRPDLGINEEPRQYYRLTGVGAKVLAAESRRLSAKVEYAEEAIPGVL